MIELNHIEVKGRLHDITFKVQEHEFVWIRGSNESGKKTLLDVCTGFQKADAGTIAIMNHTKLNSRIYRKQIDYLTSDSYWAYNKTIYQNMWFTGHRATVDHALHEVGLNNGYLYLHECSKEQKMQILLARMILKSPKIVFIYEWLKDLDAEASQRMMDQLYRIYLQYELTVVFASWQSHEGYRHIVLNHGYVVGDQYA